MGHVSVSFCTSISSTVLNVCSGERKLVWKSDGDGEGAGRLVQKINKSIGQDPESEYLIGVLDIYGFESFQNNR